MIFHKVDDPVRLHALIEALLLIEVDADLDDLLDTILEASIRMVGARYGALGVVASDGQTLSRFLTRGIDDEGRRAIGELPHGGGVLGEVIHRDAPLRLDNLPAYPGFVGFPANHPPMTRFLGVPVSTGDGHVFGNLYLTDPLDGEPFDEQDEYVVEAFGRAAGLVIDQTRLRAQLRELTLINERERLARDLHDTVIQRLFGVGLTLQIALGRPMDDAVRDRVNHCVDELDITIRQIRTTIFEIDQDDEESGPLSLRIEALADEVRSRLGIDVAVARRPTWTGWCRTTARTTPSRRCARRSATSRPLSGVVGARGRHALRRPDRRQRRRRRRRVLHQRRAGPGLRNLSQRAGQLGGTFEVDAEPGRGTPSDGPPSDRPDVIRLMLVDDHEIVRRGLKELLEAAEDLSVVAEASNMTEAEAITST